MSRRGLTVLLALAISFVYEKSGSAGPETPQRRHVTDRQLSQLSPIDALGFFYCYIAGFQDPARVNQKCFSSRCERDLLSLSLEQAGSERQYR